MIENNIIMIGLSRVQQQTLFCQFPLSFFFYSVSVDDIVDEQDIVKIITQSGCVFINPRALKPGMLRLFVDVQKDAAYSSHAAIMLFTDSFTKEQKYSVNLKELRRVDLRARLDRTLRTTIKMLRNATMPCWEGMKRMEGNMFNDGWYLIDIETSGLDPLESDVIALKIFYMANYVLRPVDTIYIKPQKPIEDEIAEITGITNEMLENGITKEEAVEYLNNLHYKAPLLLERYDFFVPFLKALYHSCGQKFDMPYVTLDGLAAIVFGHLLWKKPMDIPQQIEDRRIERVPVEDPYMAQLCDLTLAIFENLQDRYAVRAAGDFHKLYYAMIECGE